MAKKIDVLSYLPGFKRIDPKKTPGKHPYKAIYFTNEDNTVNLSTRQAQEVAHGKKSLSEAIAISFKGKRVGGLGWKIPTDSYEFKDIFEARDFVLNAKSLHGRRMFLQARGYVPLGVASGEPGKDKWLSSRRGVVTSNTYTSDKYWERIIDDLGNQFQGDPNKIAITFVG